ncbi:hypothetical protein C3L33_18692, partial [Rhododendron williamsianum]
MEPSYLSSGDIFLASARTLEFKYLFFENAGKHCAYESNLFEHDEGSYNAMVRVLGREDCVKKFWRLADEMRGAGFEMARETYIEVLGQIVKRKMIKDAVDLYEFAMGGANKPSIQDFTFLLRKVVVNKDLDLDMDLVLKVIQAFTEGGNVLTDSNVDAVLKSLTSVGRLGECNKILKAMEEGGFLPSDTLRSKIAFQLSSKGEKEEANEFVDTMEAFGSSSNNKIWASLVEGYCVAGHLDEASDCFQKMVEKEGGSCVAYAVELLVNAYCNKNRAMDACKLVIDTINEKQLKPSHSTYKLLTSKVLVQGGLKEALELLGCMKVDGFPPFLDPFIDYLSKTGTADEARLFLEGMTVKRVPSTAVFVRVFEAYLKAGRHNEAHNLLSKCPRYIRNHADILDLFFTMRTAGSRLPVRLQSAVISFHDHNFSNNGICEGVLGFVEVMKKKGYGVKKGAGVRALERFEKQGDEVEKSVRELKVSYLSKLVSMVLGNLGLEPNNALKVGCVDDSNLDAVLVDLGNATRLESNGGSPSERKRTSNLVTVTAEIFSKSSTGDEFKLELDSNYIVITNGLVDRVLQHLGEKNPDAARRFFGYVLDRERERFSERSCYLMMDIIRSSGSAKEHSDFFKILREKRCVPSRLEARYGFESRDGGGSKYPFRDLMFVFEWFDMMACTLVLLVIRQQVWGDWVEKRLRELDVSYSSELVSEILGMVEEEAAMMFFRWLQESNLFEHDERTYGTMLGVLGIMGTTNKGSIETFWRVANEMRGAGFGMSGEFYVNAWPDLLERWPIEDAVDLYEFAMGFALKPSIRHCSELLGRVVEEVIELPNPELDMNLFHRVLKAFTEGGNALTDLNMDYLLKSLSIRRPTEIFSKSSTSDEFKLELDSKDIVITQDLAERVLQHLDGSAKEFWDLFEFMRKKDYGAGERRISALKLEISGLGLEMLRLGSEMDGRWQTRWTRDVIIRQHLGVDGAEKRLRELDVSYSSELVSMILREFGGWNSEEAMMFFRWLQESNLFEHDGGTYNTMLGVLGPKRPGGSYCTETFSRVADEMKGAGFEMSENVTPGGSSSPSVIRGGFPLDAMRHSLAVLALELEKRGKERSSSEGKK